MTIAPSRFMLLCNLNFSLRACYYQSFVSLRLSFSAMASLAFA